MAEPNANLLRSAISFFTPPSQKAPTANPDHPNFFSIISATANLVKDNLFKDDKEGFKFNTPEDFQVEALKNWDTGSIDKNNPQNQDNYLKAIGKIMTKDEGFIRKCSESGVSKERIDKIKIYKKSEYIRLETNIINQPLKFVSHKIKLTRKPENFYTEGDVASEAYRKLQKDQSLERPDPSRYQTVKGVVIDAGTSAFNAARVAGNGIKKGVKSAGEAAVRVLNGDPNVNSWRVEDVPDNYDGGFVNTNMFRLRSTILQQLSERAGPASTSFSYEDALKNSKRNSDGYGNPSSRVRNLEKQVQENKIQLGQLYGERAGSRLHTKGVRAPGAGGRGGR